MRSRPLGYGENTLIVYIWGDNGSSAEGQDGTISELLAQNGIPTTIKQHIAALNALGGLDVLGTALTDNQYHSGWAWAGAPPTREQAPRLTFRRHAQPDGDPLAGEDQTGRDATYAIPPLQRPRSRRFTKSWVSTPPREVGGVPQDPIDGVSFAYSFDDPNAEGRLRTQYFEVMGSRAIYHDAWMACAIGPRPPWVTGTPAGIREWTPDKDVWELYDLTKTGARRTIWPRKCPRRLHS